MNNIKLQNCFLRYEPNINHGTMFLFNKKTGQMLEGDYYSYVIINAIKNSEELVPLAKRISLENQRALATVQEEIKSVIQMLEKKGFIINEHNECEKK